MPRSVPTNSTSKLPSLEPLVLLQGVREICELVNPSEPLTVSQRAFDAARPRSASFKDIPLARNIASTLRLSWREVLELAYRPPGVQNHHLSRKQTSPYQDWLTDDYIGSVLKLVARRLGVNTLTLRQYRRERDAMLAVDRARWLHGGQLMLPTDDQIAMAAGDWDRALSLAGLAPRPGLGDQGKSKIGLTPAELLERCYEVHGTQATARELRDFARANKIPHARLEYKKWLEWVAEWKASRLAKGLPVPSGPQARNARPDYSRDMGAAIPGKHRLNQWSAEDCIQSVTHYLEQLKPGQRSSRRGYDDWASKQERAPQVSIFDQHKGWEAVRRKAQARMRKDNKAMKRESSDLPC